MGSDLENARVLVTGGSSGLGRAIALAFATCGARVAVNYVADAEGARAVVSEIERGGGTALAIQADVSVSAQVAAMFAQVDARWEDIDILVNNAGIDGTRAMSWESEEEDFARVIDINLKGAYLCAREALRRMVPRKAGVVLNMSSVHDRIPWSGYSAYAASKAGLSMMARSMAQEAAPHGVRVLCLAPGAIRTPINEDVWSNPQSRADLMSKIPLGRIGEPEDIANMAVMLASPRASYVTGATLYVDGGMTLYPEFAHGG